MRVSSLAPARKTFSRLDCRRGKTAAEAASGTCVTARRDHLSRAPVSSRDKQPETQPQHAGRAVVAVPSRDLAVPVSSVRKTKKVKRFRDFRAFKAKAARLLELVEGKVLKAPGAAEYRKFCQKAGER